MIENSNAGALPTVDTVEEVLTRLVDTASVDSVFSDPVERGNSTVIACSEVSVGLGFGYGSGGGPTGELKTSAPSGGGGAGAGGGARGRPVAAIVITQQGVRVEPILDLTKIVLAALTTGAFVLVWLARLGRATRKGPSFDQFKRALDS